MLLLGLLLVFAAVFYGCNHSRINAILGQNRNAATLDRKSTQELIQEQGLMSAWHKGLLVLVNKENPLSEDYVPVDLAPVRYYVANRPPDTWFMRADAAKSFEAMVEAAAEEGIEFAMTTGYRSYAYQKSLYDTYVGRSGVEAADLYSAKPGQSEHQTGLAVDVSSSSINYQLLYTYGNTKEGSWLSAHAHEFGFIIRYPKDKEEITGFHAEPWHLRYVGVYAATEIVGLDMTLEEYLKAKGMD